MRRKRWLTVAMIVTAAVAVMMAATSYKEIGKKLEMQGEDQQTMLVAGYELQTETEASTAKTETSDTEMASETEKETKTKETETRTSAAADPSKPVLKLKQKKIEIKVGDAFDAVSQVSEITDDTDDRSALFRQIEVHGDYSTDEPGTYTLTYTAMDSDGNVSAPVTLELVVKG
ncbi:DUF5011 domain-containing protein [Lachnospiraceae bacterium CLA-AA-H246]|uniref:DUF5011 domain-containing protein n=1 Tax=Hominisplanchenecus faecis TaxID=2885351 RepID=A0ABS8EXA4_9FIRM|nr:immunoglobulin-like domain-containing protein [Hominisplanchenecus faecis]MCC2149816.1 DUF5011 domain-containing protein [Hominisplanchenecus faecis]